AGKRRNSSNPSAARTSRSSTRTEGGRLSLASFRITETLQKMASEHASCLRESIMKRSLSAIGLIVALSSPLVNAAIFSESFGYEDGPLTTVSGGLWFKHDTSVAVEQLQVQNGAARLSFSNAEDVARSLGQNYTSGTLFYSTVLTM